MQWVIKKQGNLLYSKITILIKMTVLCLGLSFFTFCQELPNLVQNYSFEENISCSPGANSINDVLYWYNFFQTGTPGYFSECSIDFYATTPLNVFGYQVPKTGKSYGFQGNFRLNHKKHYINSSLNPLSISKESFSGQFSEQLIAGKYYHLEFYVSRCSSSSSFIATDAFDLLISKDSTSYSYPYPPFINDNYIVWSNESGHIIEDTINWVKLSGCFTPKGGEQFFTIGSFRDTASINNIFYSNTENTYIAAYFYDDFLIYQCDTCCPDQYPIEDYITVNNNLITQGETATFETFLNKGHTANLYLFDSAGRVVYNAKLNGTDNSHEVPNNLAAGVYHYAMVTSEKKKLGGKIVVVN